MTGKGNYELQDCVDKEAKKTFPLHKLKIVEDIEKDSEKNVEIRIFHAKKMRFPFAFACYMQTQHSHAKRNKNAYAQEKAKRIFFAFFF